MNSCAHRGVSLWFGRNEDKGLPLPVSRLEVRRHRPVRRRASRSPKRAAIARRSSSSPIRWSSAAGCCGPTYGPERTDAAAARMGIRYGAGPPALRHQAVPGIQLACRPWKAASIQATCRSCTAATSNTDPLFKGAKGNQLQHGGPRARCSRWWRAPAGLLHRGAPQSRE